MPEIHVIKRSEAGEVVVWLDTDAGIEDGLCIGAADTVRDALRDAVKELDASLKTARALLAAFDHNLS